MHLMAIVDVNTTASLNGPTSTIAVLMAPPTITELDHWSIELADHTQLDTDQRERDALLSLGGTRRRPASLPPEELIRFWKCAVELGPMTAFRQPNGDFMGPPRVDSVLSLSESRQENAAI